MKYFLSCLSLILLKIYHLCQAPKPFLFNIIPLSHKAQCKYCYTHLRDKKPRLNMVKQYSQYFQNKYLAEQEFKLWNIWLQNLYSFNKITYAFEKREKETKFTDLNGNTKELILEDLLTGPRRNNNLQGFFSSSMSLLFFSPPSV